jgi:hypothetical protein
VTKRAAEAGVGDRLHTVEGTLGNLGAALEGYGEASFRGAFSTFGAFNLEKDLSSAGECLATVLAPWGPLFLGVLNRHAIVPIVAAIGSRHWRGVGARFRNPIPAEGSRFPLDVYSLTPRRLTRILGPAFRLENAEAASVLAPPDDLPRLRRFIGPRGKAALRHWDAVLARTRVGTEVAEWQFLTYRRLATSPANG